MSTPTVVDRPGGNLRVGPRLSRIEVILDLIDGVLADCEPQLVALRTAVDEVSTPTRVLPAE